MGDLKIIIMAASENTVTGAGVRTKQPSLWLARFVLVLCAAATAVLPAYGDDIPAILTPGGSVSPLPDFSDNTINITNAEADPFGSGSAPSGILATLVGTSLLNPFGSNDLFFEYNIAPEVGDVVQLSLSGFSGFETAIKMLTVTPDGTFVGALDANGVQTVTGSQSILREYPVARFCRCQVASQLRIRRIQAS